ncbi:UNVERIFIED_CONTAM: hypothetical protein Sindi_1671100 [Sesamum indicum]
MLNKPLFFPPLLFYDGALPNPRFGRRTVSSKVASWETERKVRPMKGQWGRVVVAGRETAVVEWVKNQISRKEDEGSDFSNAAILAGVSTGNGRKGSTEDSGFLEPETSLPEKSSASDVFPAILHGQGVVRGVGESPMEKDATLQPLEGKQKLGFGSSKGAVNGGRDSSSPVTEFNFEEFL